MVHSPFVLTLNLSTSNCDIQGHLQTLKIFPQDLICPDIYMQCLWHCPWIFEWFHHLRTRESIKWQSRLRDNELLWDGMERMPTAAEFWSTERFVALQQVLVSDRKWNKTSLRAIAVLPGPKLASGHLESNSSFFCFSFSSLVPKEGRPCSIPLDGGNFIVLKCTGTQFWWASPSADSVSGSGSSSAGQPAP